jgi:hypothetical protein
MKSIPSFESKKELFDFLIENKYALIAEKKYSVKQSDAVLFDIERFDKEDATKAITDPSTYTGDKLRVKSVINTTGLMDSHDDVHISGLWNKTLKENKNIYLLQEHKMSFATIISDSVKASAVDMNWSDLGYNKVGKTQALVFDSTLTKERNPFMFEQYLKGYVKNHSVGMQYVKIDMAINDKSYPAEYSVWEKYISEVVNQKDAVEQGYFWAVTEAKIVEGSAVVMGSNKVTPTISVEEKQEPSKDTQTKIEPLFINTQAAKEIINNFKFIK